ncbi:hypothetical protein B9G69_010510 [Bdellovibrio sp. SKB1291214]|uniref:hypothetical protein n=1 Tax=Bdellovibrio sp. SKB1291214 TaxID=1732569 RepID=UPI000B51513F|nr:hypothetical protein [Bdellovibrio sp. SKB1291214]UYL07476.1 hypothetical protein B9G69_010510 [Bdellovibrio sp. SKB1291214]
MKNMILAIAALIVGQTANAAISANSSWEEINAAKGPYQIVAPVVYMGRAIDYTFVCRNGDTLQTIKPVDIVEVVQPTNQNGRTEFKVVGSEVLSTSINYTHKESFCDQTKGDRTVCKDVVYTGTYPMTVNVKVYTQVGHNQPARLLFTKAYTVPTCDNASVN